jgi:hypothetical protein
MRAIRPLLGYVSFALLLNVVFVSAPFFYDPDIVMPADTHTLWSYVYLVFLAWLEHGQVLWWDPTTLNGWPAYVNAVSGWFNYFGPYAVPYFLIAKPLHAIGVDINTLILIQKLLYTFVLNAIAFTLIVRLLVTAGWARLLAVTLFALSDLHLYGLLNSCFTEALPAALFFTYAVLRYFKHQDTKSLQAILVFGTLFAASINYVFILTSLYWIGAVLVLGFAIVPGAARALPAATIGLITPGRRATTVVFGLAMAAGLGAVAVPFAFHAADLIRVTGTGVIDYASSLAGSYPPPTYDIRSFQGWSFVNLWVPFREMIQPVFMQHPSGVDYRYLGILSFPLILAAMIFKADDAFVWVLLLSAVLCIVVIPYTHANIAFNHLIQNVDLFKKTRWLGSSLPRTGPNLLLILLVALGLDALLRRVSPSANTFGDAFVNRLFLAVLAVLPALFAIGFVAAAISDGVFRERFLHGLGHLAIFSALVSALLLALTLRVAPVRSVLAGSLICVAVMDVGLAISDMWRPVTPLHFFNHSESTRPTAESLTAASAESEVWFGTDYDGMVHGIYDPGPHFGTRAWLALATRPRWNEVLQNWNSISNRMTAYPAFRFVEVAEYTPFESIHDLASLPTPAEKGIDAYLHDRDLALGLRPDGAGVANGDRGPRWSLEGFGPNTVTLAVTTPRDVVLMHLDNYDRFWTARIDGRAAPVHRANFTFKALFIEAGDHSVTLAYDPWPIKAAWAAFYSLLAAGLAIAALAARRSRAGPRSPGASRRARPGFMEPTDER